MTRRALRPILGDMLAFAEEAVEYVGSRGGAELEADRMRLRAATRALEVVGEAATRLPRDFGDVLDYDFGPAIAMRHRLIHGYDSASAATIAQTVSEDLPELIGVLRRALAGRLPDEVDP